MICNFRTFVLLSATLIMGCQQSEAPQAVTAEPTAAKTPTTANDQQAPVAQLPDDVQPRHYALDFTIIPDETHFSGQARIEVELARELDRFWLHGLNLEVSRAVIQAGGKTIAAEYSEHGNPNTTMTAICNNARWVR